MEIERVGMVKQGGHICVDNQYGISSGYRGWWIIEGVFAINVHVHCFQENLDIAESWPRFHWVTKQRLSY